MIGEWLTEYVGFIVHGHVLEELSVPLAVVLLGSFVSRTNATPRIKWCVKWCTFRGR